MKLYIHLILLLLFHYICLINSWKEWKYDVSWTKNPDIPYVDRIGASQSWADPDIGWGPPNPAYENDQVNIAPRPRRGHSMVKIEMTEEDCIPEGSSGIALDKSTCDVGIYVVIFGGRDNDGLKTHIPKGASVIENPDGTVGEFITYEDKPENPCHDTELLYYTKEEQDLANCDDPANSETTAPVGFVFNDVWAYKVAPHTNPNYSPYDSSVCSRYPDTPCLPDPTKLEHTHGWVLWSAGALEGGCEIQLGEEVCTTPSERYLHQATAFNDGAMYVYGGFSQRCQDYCDDMWMFDIFMKGWRQVYNTGDLSRYYNVGQDGSFIAFNALADPPDYVPLDNADPPNAGPGKRWKHTMVGDGVRIVIFGGHRLWHGFSPENLQDNDYGLNSTRQFGGYLNDLWLYTKVIDKITVTGSTFKSTEGSWTYLEFLPECMLDVGTPGAITCVWPDNRAGHSSIFDPKRNRVWIFGGYRSYFPYLKTDGIGSGPGMQTLGIGGFVPYPAYDHYKSDLWYYDLGSGLWTEVKPVKIQILKVRAYKVDTPIDPQITFKLKFRYYPTVDATLLTTEETSCISITATADEVQAALEGLDAIDAGGVSVTRTGVGDFKWPYEFEWRVFFKGNAQIGELAAIFQSPCTPSPPEEMMVWIESVDDILPPARSGAVLEIVNETLVLHGGYADNYLLDDMWYFNISTSRWLEKKNFVDPIYPADTCAEGDEEYIARTRNETNDNIEAGACFQLHYPKHLLRGSEDTELLSEDGQKYDIKPYTVDNTYDNLNTPTIREQDRITGQEYYWPGEIGGPNYEPMWKIQDFDYETKLRANLIEESLMPRWVLYTDGSTNSLLPVGHPMIPYAANGPDQWVRKFRFQINDTSEVFRDYSVGGSSMISLYEWCLSATAEVTRGKRLDGEAGRSVNPIMIRVKRRRNPGWDGCQNLPYKKPSARFQHQMVYISESEELFLYGGMGYYEEEAQRYDITHPTKVYDDFWRFNISECIGNCSNHGDCFYGFCKCYKGYYGIDCSNTSCPGTACYYDTLTHDEICQHTCQASHNHTDGEGFIQDAAKVPCSKDLPGEENGICNGWGKSYCAPPFIGEDCSIRDCKNNCTFRGYCSVEFPVSRCMCNPGYYGEECEFAHCLNNCSYPNGLCNTTTGECDCHLLYNPYNSSKLYYGRDPVDHITRRPISWDGPDCSYLHAFSAASRRFDNSNLTLLLIIMVILLSYSNSYTYSDSDSNNSHYIYDTDDGSSSSSTFSSSESNS